MIVILYQRGARPRKLPANARASETWLTRLGRGPACKQRLFRSVGEKPP